MIVLDEGHASARARTVSRQHDRGAAAVELVIVVPALVLIMALMMAGWRIWSTRTEVTMAAQAGARAASLASSGAQARQAAEQAVATNLATAGILCRSRRVQVDVAAFALPAGQPGSVRVRVTCTVPLSDLLVPGLPGSITATSDATAVLDTFRRRQP